MIDKLMLQDVRNVLEKLKIIKTSENYEELLNSHGIDLSLNGEELDKAIVANMMSDKEYQLFTRYIKFRKYQNLSNMKSAIDSLAESKQKINYLYNSRKSSQEYIDANQTQINRVMTELDEVSFDELLRINHSIVASLNSYNRLGRNYEVKQKTLSEKIDKIKNSKVIIKAIKEKIVESLERKLSKMVKKHNASLIAADSKIKVQEGELSTELHNYCLSLLESSILFDAILLNEKTINTENVTPVYNVNGVRTASNLFATDQSLIISKLKETIRKALRRNPNEINFSTIIKRVFTSIYQEDIEYLQLKRKEDLQSVQEEYAKQQELIQELGIYQASFEIPLEDFTENEHDTLSIAYRTEMLKK